jgi:choline dehydrogenase-like flavoprotein
MAGRPAGDCAYNSAMTATGGPSPLLGTSARPYFAVVIGSGFGGAVAACRLAQARATLVDPASDELPICLLERGRRFAREDFPRLQLPDYLTADPARVTSKRVPEISRMFWDHDQGLWELRNLGELRVAQAAGLGGGSLIYASVHLRPPDDVFQGWPRTCGDGCRCLPSDPPAYDRAGLRGYYDLVAEMLDIEPLPPGLRARYGKTAAMAEVARALYGSTGEAARFFHPPLAVRFGETAEPLADGKNRFGRAQSDCTGCGNCTIGCQEGAKSSLDLNYLAIAEDLGVEVRTLCEVLTLEPPAGGEGSVKIRLLDHLQPGQESELFAQHVFLCAGAVGSTEILLRSRAPGPTRPLGGGRLGHGFYANGDNLAALFDTKVPLGASAGPTITTTLLHTGPPAAAAAVSPAQTGGTWFLLQDGGLPPSLAEGIGLFRSPLWLARNRFRPPGWQPAGAAAASPAGPFATERRPAAALARGLRQFLPRTLDPLLDRLRGIDKVAADHIRRVNDRVARAIDDRLQDSLLGKLLLVPLRRRLAGDDELLAAAVAALAEQYPLLRDLFTAGRPMELLLSLARHLLFSGTPDGRAGLLLVMGPDQRGQLIYRNGYLRIRWQKVENSPLYSLQERLLRDTATVLDAELRTNPDWTLGRTPLTVHGQGGCGMSASPGGVTRPCGQLWSCGRVYVLDGAAFPGSVGVNPSSTIAAVAERNIEIFIRQTWQLAPGAYREKLPDGARPPSPARAQRRRPIVESFDRLLPRELPPAVAGVPRSPPIGLTWHEEMNGHLSTDPVAGPLAFTSFSRPPRAARTDLDVRPFDAAERRGPLAGLRVDARLDVTVDDLDRFLLERRPRLRVEGTVGILRHLRRSAARRERYPTEGSLYFDLQADHRPAGSRLWAQDRKLVAMTYDLRVKMGRRRVPLLARKLIADDPGMDFWSDLSTLYVVARTGRWWVGVMRVQLSRFLQQQLPNIKVLGEGAEGAVPADDVTRGWAFLRFASFFVGNVKNVYSQWL